MGHLLSCRAGQARLVLADVEILADHRERSSGLPDLLARHPGVLVTGTTLRQGDYRIGDLVGIERKTAHDFAKSIVDGRLFTQMSALRRSCDRPLLLLEGLVPEAEISGVPAPAIRGALVSVCAVFGVPVLHSSGLKESAELIVVAARQIERSFGERESYVRPGYRPKGWKKRSLYILQGLPGIGPKRAEELLTAFGSAGAALAADEATLGRVPGVGPEVARGIRRCLAVCASNQRGTLRSPNPQDRSQLASEAAGRTSE